MTKGFVFVLGLVLGALGAFVGQFINRHFVGPQYVELAWCRLGDAADCEKTATFAGWTKCTEAADHLNMMCDHTTPTHWQCELNAGQRYTNRKYECRGDLVPF